ncbi:MAG: PRC-barrel domain-containing protein [Thiohalocapsa sp.]
MQEDRIVSTKAMSAAIAVIMAASMPMAMAADTTTTATPNAPAAQTTATTAAPNAKTANRVMPGQMKFTDMNGAAVYGRDNKDIGKIDEVVLDPSGKVAAVVIKNGGFLGIGGKDVAVAMNDLKVSTDKNDKLRFTLDMTENQLKSAQAYELNPPKPNTATGSSTPPARTTTPTPPPAARH